MRAKGPLFLVALAGCSFDPEAHPDARAVLVHDAPAAAPVEPIPLPEPLACECTTVGPSESDDMTLPFSPNTAYVGGASQVKSADLNDIQAQIVANIGDLITAMGGAAPDDLLTMFRRGSFESAQFWIREQFLWPLNLSFAASQVLASVISGKVGLSSSANTSVATLAPGVAPSPCPHSVIRMRVLDAANTATICLHQQTTTGTIATDFRTIDDLDTVRFVMDWRAYITAVGASNLDVFMGIHEEPANASPDDGTAHSFVMFRKLSTDTNWRARHANDTTSGVDADTAVAPVANTWQNFRLEYNGLATPAGVAAGGQPVIRLFINGVLVAEDATGAAPSGSVGLGFLFRIDARSPGPVGDQDFVVGPVRMQWNPIAL